MRCVREIIKKANISQLKTCQDSFCEIVYHVYNFIYIRLYTYMYVCVFMYISQVFNLKMPKSVNH